MLTCECSDYDGDGWFYTFTPEFKPLATKKRKRCRSCRELISLGADCVEFDRRREPRTDIEERIYGEGDTIELASYFLCEKCGEIFLNLEDVGFCLDIDQNMNEYLRDYHEMTGFQPALSSK